MTVPRIIEFSVALLLAFLLITLISFLTLRPSLKELRAEAGSEWELFLREVRERNKLLPGLVEAFKVVESGYGKLAGQVLEARAISTRSTDPDRVVAAVNAIEASLVQLERITNARPEVAQYPPFAVHWKKVCEITNRITLLRKSYNKTTRVYNRLLTPFPQNLLAALFGFVPLAEYTPVRTLGDRPDETRMDGSAGLSRWLARTCGFLRVSTGLRNETARLATGTSGETGMKVMVGPYSNDVYHKVRDRA